MKREQSEKILKAKNYVFRLLGYRPRSVKETKERLRNRGYPLDVIKKVIEDLKRANCLNDLEFARFWVESRLRIKPGGISLLCRELKSKGVDEEVIEEVLCDIKKDYSEKELAKSLALSRLRRYSELDEMASKRRTYAFLQRRGFSVDLIGQVMDEIENEK